MARVELDLPAYLDTVHPVIHPQYLKRTHRRRRDAGVRDALEEAFARVRLEDRGWMGMRWRPVLPGRRSMCPRSWRTDGARRRRRDDETAGRFAASCVPVLG